MSQPTVYRAIPHNFWQLKWGKVLQQTEPNYTLDRCQWTAAVQESCSKTWDFHRWYICIVTTLTEFKPTFFLFSCFLSCVNRGGAARFVQPPAGPRGPDEVLHCQGAAAGSELRRGGQGRGGQLAGSHDPALQQRSLAGGWILPPRERQR